jgi:hypothetical protein
VRGDGTVWKVSCFRPLSRSFIKEGIIFLPCARSSDSNGEAYIALLRISVIDGGVATDSTG